MATTASHSGKASAERVGTQAAPKCRVQVWDVPTRLFHWSVVVLVGASWITADMGLVRVHLWSGALLLTLLLFRIIWGFVGSTTARFSNFVGNPKTVAAYVSALLRGDKPLHAGHNPPGGWMVVALLTMLTVQVTSGLFANNDIHFNGPLAMLISKEASDQLTDLHATLFNVVLVLVWIHVVAVFFYRFVKGEDLIVPMLTGTKCSTSVPCGTILRFARLSVAVLSLLTAAAVVWWLVRS